LKTEVAFSIFWSASASELSTVIAHLLHAVG
jgi:hypothetical protein